MWCDAQRRVVERCDAPRRVALPTVMSISPNVAELSACPKSPRWISGAAEGDGTDDLTDSVHPPWRQPDPQGLFECECHRTATSEVVYPSCGQFRSRSAISLGSAFPNCAGPHQSDVSRHRRLAKRNWPPSDLKQEPSLAARPQFAGEPSHGIRLHRIDGNGNSFSVLAGGALESAIFKPALTGRDAPQGHPVLAHRTRRPIGDRATHKPVPQGPPVAAPFLVA
jgi:hypothetical protein